MADDQCTPYHHDSLINMCLGCDAENSETQMGREMTYKMLVRALASESGEELVQLVSESFIVCLTLTFITATPLTHS